MTLAACVGEDSLTGPRQAPSSAHHDVTLVPGIGRIVVCLSAGTAGTYQYHVSVSGGGNWFPGPGSPDVVIPADAPVLPAAPKCRDVYFAIDPATWPVGASAAVTITQTVSPHGLGVDSVTATGDPSFTKVVGATSATVHTRSNDVWVFFYNGVANLHEGCGTLFWGAHANQWGPTGYGPTQTVGSLFSEASRYKVRGRSLSSYTLDGGLDYKPGASTALIAGALVRTGIAAVLNASHPGIGLGYPYSKDQVIAWVNAALKTENRFTMLALAGKLEVANLGSGGCPLD